MYGYVQWLGRRAMLALAASALISACGSPASSGATRFPTGTVVPVVATTTVFADLVQQVGGSRVDVRSLVPKGGEVHTFDPTPSDVQKITEAKVIVRNGLGLDDWLTALAEDAGTSAPIVTLGEGLDGVTYLEGEGGAGSVNPHLWLDVAYASKYVDRIQAALTDVDPAGASEYAARASAYKAVLTALDADVRQRLDALPASNRVVVSFHDAFPYFAAAYGLTVVGTIIDAPGQDPSAGQIADLVRAIRASGAKAIFAEAQFSDALVKAVASETGATVVSDLYDDTLGDAPVDTYVGMMTWNADRVVDALRSR
ncbi:MAG TPA: metal ABC transporter substrate-binding protein [Candidatus Limnocylindrales bacterium]